MSLFNFLRGIHQKKKDDELKKEEEPEIAYASFCGVQFGSDIGEFLSAFFYKGWCDKYSPFTVLSRIEEMREKGINFSYLGDYGEPNAIGPYAGCDYVGIYLSHYHNHSKKYNGIYGVYLVFPKNHFNSYDLDALVSALYKKYEMYNMSICKDIHCSSDVITIIDKNADLYVKKTNAQFRQEEINIERELRIEHEVMEMKAAAERISKIQLD